MNVLTKLAVAATFAFAASNPVLAQQTDHEAHHPATAASEQPVTNDASPAVADSSMSEGTIRKVDKEQKKITIRHGELKNLDMPPMSMVFQVADPAFVEQVNVGDEVNFIAEKLDGKYTVMRIEKKN